MEELMGTNHIKKYLLSIFACVLFFLFMGIGQVWASDTSEATTYLIHLQK